MNILEKTQYQAALAITGAWKGTNTDKIYEELGWESLDQRRVFRRLTMAYKIFKNMTPTYLKEHIPLNQTRYSLRGNCKVALISCNKNRFQNSFFPNTIKLWNGLDDALKNSSSLRVFKASIIKIIRPSKKEAFNILDPTGLRLIFQLRVGLSPLLEHKKGITFMML